MSFDKGQSHLTAAQWAKRLPLIQAFVAGKRLQVDSGGDGVWQDANPGGHYSFCCPERWRIKPAQSEMWRQWRALEVPAGAVVRRKGTTSRSIIAAVSGAETGDPRVSVCLDSPSFVRVEAELGYLLAAYEWLWPAEAMLTDAEWRICGVRQ
jgi:hypothetical protein